MSHPFIGVPKPQSVEQAEVTVLTWQYLEGNETVRHTSVWRDGVEIATGRVSLGCVGAVGGK